MGTGLGPDPDELASSISTYRKCTTRSSGSGNSRARRCVRTCVAVRSAPASSRRRRAGSCWRGRSTSGRSCGRREWTRRTMRRSGHCRCTAAPLPGSAALCGNLAPAQRCHRECLWESVHGADAADGGDLSSAGAERAGLPYRLSRGPSPRTSHPFMTARRDRWNHCRLIPGRGRLRVSTALRCYYR